MRLQPQPDDTPGENLPFRVIQTIAGLRQEAGGTTTAVLKICEELAKRAVSVDLVTQRYCDSDSIPCTGGFERPYRIHAVPALHLAGTNFVYSHLFGPFLEALCARREPLLVHDNGLWLPSNIKASSVAKRMSKPLIISTHGMLSAVALGHSAIHKRIAWRLYQKAALFRADAVCATTTLEADEIDRYCRGKIPIAIVPYGIDIPEPRDIAPLAGDPVALFIGRLHPIKGLDMLVRAWAKVRPAGWRLEIVGPEERGYAAMLRAMVSSLGLDQIISISGFVTGEDRERLFGRASLVIVPSHSESFGMVIGEALARGRPVITTTGTPWHQIGTMQCGWYVEPAEASLAVALEEATSTSEAILKAMGGRGKALIEAEYNWAKIAPRLIALYRWTLGNGPRPQAVVGQ